MKKLLSILLCVFLAAGCFGFALAEETETPEALCAKGEAAYDLGDYETALQYILPAAEQGYADAQCVLGNMYYYGYGVEQSYEKAFECFWLAAEMSDSYGQNNAGDCYENGTGVEKSLEKAIEYYRLSAAQDNPYAIEALARLAEEGLLPAEEPAPQQE